MKEYGKAIENYNRAIALNTHTWENAAAYNSRGRTYRILTEYELALPDFKYVLEHDPSYISTYGNVGITYLWMKDVKQAKSSYTRGLELDPKMISYAWMVEWTNM